MTASTETQKHIRIPRTKDNDYTHEIAALRREFIRRETGAYLSHLGQYSAEPEALPGNIENFIGIAQAPIGIAGPLHINCEQVRRPGS